MVYLGVMRYVLILLAVALLVTLFATELSRLDNVVGIKPMLIGAAVLGAGLGALLGFLGGRRLQGWEQKVPLLLGGLIYFALLGPMASLFLNRVLAASPSDQKMVFLNQEPFLQSRIGMIEGMQQLPTGWYAWLQDHDEVLRIRTKQQYFLTAQKGDTVLVPVAKGFFGARIIKVQ